MNLSGIDERRLTEFTEVVSDCLRHGGGEGTITLLAAVAFFIASGASFHNARELAKHWFASGGRDRAWALVYAAAPTAPPKPARPDMTCLFHGELTPGEEHPDCPVVQTTTEGGIIIKEEVCMCECRPCKRAWFAAGIPIIRNGRILKIEVD